MSLFTVNLNGPTWSNTSVRSWPALPSQNTLVQSYGSRCVRPPVIYGDVEFIEPMTVKDTVYAQSLTSKHVKGMLTGPVTILNWSFLETTFREKKSPSKLGLLFAKK